MPVRRHGQRVDLGDADAVAQHLVHHACCRSSACSSSAASTLKDFAFALLVGILSGAYSSIFVASPVLTILKEREPQYKKLKAAARADQA